MQDEIRTEIVIAAPVGRVWRVLTEADHIGQWFGDSAEVDLRPGGVMTLEWKEHGRFLATVDTIDPPRYFSYRWARSRDTEPATGNSTLVEFTLTELEKGTKLEVVETGFTTLEIPSEEQRAHRDGNIEGWTIELNELREYAEQSAK